jgi:UDP-2-acetamido-2,6-beta-L-arabino-hexul-4-ose reductase
VKIGITGQSGFIGTHLSNFLSLQDKVELIPFEGEFFKDQSKLQRFVQSCDTIVHLAALNRHNDPNEIYTTNIQLVKKLIEACELTHSKPHILFSSSTQEERGNPYGNSKKEGRVLFENWAKRNKAMFTGFVIPNVFGPFGNPYYNSFIATFCHQLTHGKEPKIDRDNKVQLIYVSKLVQQFWKSINSYRISQHSLYNDQTPPVYHKTVQVPFTKVTKVSEVLTLLTTFKTEYFENGIIPDLTNEFEKNLFNTFLCYIDHKNFFPFHLKLNTDERGSFVETVKLHSGGQVSFSTTAPGVTRGNHYHTRKAERFAVIKGKARIQLRKIGTDEILNFELDGSKPSFVDMPIWYTHNITNTGDETLYTIFWINEHFNPDDPDTYFEKV